MQCHGLHLRMLSTSVSVLPGASHGFVALYVYLSVLPHQGALAPAPCRLLTASPRLHDNPTCLVAPPPSTEGSCTAAHPCPPKPCTHLANPDDVDGALVLGSGSPAPPIPPAPRSPAPWLLA